MVDMLPLAPQSGPFFDFLANANRNAAPHGLCVLSDVALFQGIFPQSCLGWACRTRRPAAWNPLIKGFGDK
jgi:hypothetical protein